MMRKELLIETEAELKELLSALDERGDEVAMNGIAVLHAAASVHRDFIKTGVMNKMLKALSEVGQLPKIPGQKDSYEAWSSAFHFITHPEGLSSMCCAMNAMAEIAIDDRIGPPTSELKETEIN
jgi:hypothetical protein